MWYQDLGRATGQPFRTCLWLTGPLISQVVAGDRIGCTGAVRLLIFLPVHGLYPSISSSKTTNIIQNSELSSISNTFDQISGPKCASGYFDLGKLVGLAGPEAVVQIGGSACGLRCGFDSSK